MKKVSFILAVAAISFGCAKNADVKSEVKQASVSSAPAAAITEFDELNPFDPNIEAQLAEMDMDYMQSTGESPFLTQWFDIAQCRRGSCKVWLQVVKSTQYAYLYVDGQLQYSWKASTGTPGHGTPNFDKHPNGRVYDAYSSRKYPGGDYNGLGNMPYAVFIDGGFAVHGTGRSNWPRLGTRASHGCIRLHPDNAYIFNRLVRQHGIGNVWITVQD